MVDVVVGVCGRIPLDDRCNIGPSGIAAVRTYCPCQCIARWQRTAKLRRHAKLCTAFPRQFNAQTLADALAVLARPSA